MHREKTPDGKARIAFIENCYQLYEQKMYQAAYRILYDSARAEDAVQDAFLKLMKGGVYFEDAASDDCKKYIVTVIRHSAIDTAPPIPAAVLTFLETPKNGHIPRN